jgi:phosphatidate phosphatase APP1
MPFTGVASFYNALEKGPRRDNFFPFFYVSSSEWNLYDLLEDFFAHNGLPRGVFMLRKLEHSIYKFWKSGSGTHEHKYDKIRFLMELYKNQKFILIGDSGQKDPKIYNRLANDFPGRIETIYIRQIRKTADFKSPQLMALSLQRVNTSYLQVKDTKEAAKHAVKMGYIHPDSFMEHLKTAEVDTLVV